MKPNILYIMLIYKITNTINNKIYIGQTTKTLEERKKSYHSTYKSCRRPIESAMAKYGFENFTWEIIDYANTRKELDEKERYWISFYNSLTPNGYNVELGGNSIGKHSEETKRKISEAQKGELNHMYGKKGKLNHTSKPVIDLMTGKIYESACLYSEIFDVNFSHICAVARGERGSHKGKVVRYIDENDNIIQPKEVAKIKYKDVKEKILPEYKKYIK